MNKARETLFLLIGDIAIFIAALPLTLSVRYWELPSRQLFQQHLEPFAILFVVWIIVFFISGLYERHTLVLKSNLPSKILNAQIVNTLMAIVFFYAIPYFQITPKTNLFIYLFLSFGLIVLWRNAAPALLSQHRRESAVLAARKEKVGHLIEEVNNNPGYGLKFSRVIYPEKSTGDVYQEVLTALKETDSQYLVMDYTDQNVKDAITQIYWSTHPDVYLIDLTRLYEDTLKRIPLTIVNDEWCLRHLAVEPKRMYDYLKRVMDIVIAALVGIVSLPLYPFVALAIKLDDGGPVFINQDRVGRNGKSINIYKFRTMTTNDSGKWLDDDGDQRITRVGSFLRKSRIDEFPQLWNVVRGDLSLIGPRPDIVGLWRRLNDEISYYDVRTLVKPGLSGWAQIVQNEPPQSVAATRKRLSYDLYYIKNRSLWLDIKIALRTIATLLSRAGE